MQNEAIELALQHPEVTQLLARFRLGDRDAESRLVPIVYAELRAMALKCFRRERPDHTLQPTALVHETFLRLFGEKQPNWEDRVHFFAVAGRLMRQILLDYARRRQAGKRGGSLERIPLDENLEFSKDKSRQLLSLDEALCRLANQDERQSRNR